MSAPAAADWGRRNLRLLALFAPVLVVAGLAGLVLPPRLSLMSGALPYDVFHIAFGLLGLAIVRARSAPGAAFFNLGFGAVDLYQAVAGVAGIFPAALFALRPADHVVHVALGALLVGFGLRGPVRAKATSASAASPASAGRSRAEGASSSGARSGP
jgi:hypothetical protein